MNPMLSPAMQQYVAAIDHAASQELVGIGAFDWTQLINAGAEAANKGVQYKQQQDTDTAAKAASSVAAAKAVAADANWASAETQLDLATQSHDASRIAPAQALQMQAMQQAMAAGGGLSSDAQTKRVAAAQNAAQQASQAALAAPNDAAKAALSRAWQKVMAAGAASGGATALDIAKHAKKGESWWTASHAGIPGWGWVAGGTLTAAGLILLLRKLFQ